MADSNLYEKTSAPEREHASAFELIETFIYGYAIFNLINTIAIKYNKSLITQNVAIAYLSIGLMFLFVILQNYLFLKIADERYISHKKGFKFISLNSGGFRFLERIFRLFIISAVILTPKYPIESGYSSVVRTVVNPFSNFLELTLTTSEKLLLLVKSLFITDKNPQFIVRAESNEIQSFISYYAGAIFLIILLNFLWDLTNVFAVRRRKINQGTEYLKYKSRSPFRSDVFSFFSYLGLVKTSFSENGPSIVFTNWVERSDRDSGKYIESMVKKGKLAKLYFKHSPVFYSRAIGFMFCLATIAASVYETPFFAVSVMSVLATLYGLMTSQSERLLSRLGEIFSMPLRYLFTKNYS